MSEKRVTSVASPLISPAFRTPGNLTGLPRKCQDNCVDIHNTIQKWNGLNIQGVEILKQIIAARSTGNNDSEEENDDIEDLLGNEQHESQNNLEKTENTQELFGKLLSIHNQMEFLRDKLVTLSDQFKALSQLPRAASSELDHTVKYCCDAAEQISKCYSEEIDLKKTVIENAAYAKNPNEEMFLLATWTHQPYINKDLDLKLKVMLMETGSQ